MSVLMGVVSKFLQRLQNLKNIMGFMWIHHIPEDIRKTITSERKSQGSISSSTEKVFGYHDDASGRFLYESTACIAVMLSRVAQGLQISAPAGVREVHTADEFLKHILGHAKTSGVVDLLSLCVVVLGSSLMVGSSNLLRAACEVCRAMWALKNSLEILLTKKHVYMVPLQTFWRYSLLRLIVRVSDRGSMHIKIYCCLHQRLKSALSAGLQILIRLLANRLPNVPQQFDGTKDLVGFSPIGVVWTVSSICRFLSSGALSFREILVGIERVKIMPVLISEIHLMILKCWSEPGGGNDGRGVRDVFNPVIDLLAFPFVPVQNVCGLPSASASVNRGFLLNMMGSPGGRLGMEDKHMVKVIESNMPEYIKILWEVGKPGCIFWGLDHAELKFLGRPVVFLATMTGHQCLALKLLEKGLLNPSTVRKLLDGSSPRELILEVLMIVSDLAKVNKARHNIISLLIDRRIDFACFATGNAAFPYNLLYEELRRSIPLLMCCFRQRKTKTNQMQLVHSVILSATLIASVKILSLKEPCRLC